MSAPRQTSLLLRLLGLSLAVAILAIATTAWLTTRQTSEKLRAGFASTLEADSYVQQRLLDYAQAHDSWEGVHPLLEQLAAETGRRIGLTTPGGRLIADSADSAGTAGDGVDAGLPANPVAEIDVSAAAPAITTSLTTWRLTAEELKSRNRLLADAQSCIQRKDPNAPVAVSVDGALTSPDAMVFSYGFPPGVGFPPPGEQAAAVGQRIETLPEAEIAAGGADTVTVSLSKYADCIPDALHQPTAAAEQLAALYRKLAGECLTRHGLPADTPVPAGYPAEKMTKVGKAKPPSAKEVLIARCAASASRQAITSFVPPPALLYTGSADRFDPFADGGWQRIMLAGLGVLVIAAGLTLLAGRRLTKPIRALTVAANQMGGGDRDARVPVNGNDEVARLGRAFNAMADSIESGDRQRKTMVADIAHELRTPLANVSGYLEAAEDGVVPLDADLVSSLREESEHLHHLIDDLGILALADAGELRMHPEEFDAADLATRVVAAHQAAAAKAQVSLAVVAAEPVAVHADPMRLRQALANLVGNALRYTPADGSVTVTVTGDDDGVRLDVADDGPGIAPEHLPHVFDRFYRAEKSRSRATGGSGLGLAITRQLVEANGGTVDVSSSAGAGSTFTIRLPATPAG